MAFMFRRMWPAARCGICQSTIARTRPSTLSRRPRNIASTARLRDDTESSATQEGTNILKMSPEEFSISLSPSERAKWKTMSPSEREEYQIIQEGMPDAIREGHNDPKTRSELEKGDSFILKAFEQMQSDDVRQPPEKFIPGLMAMGEEDPEGTGNDDEFKEDDMTSTAHGHLDHIREIREYARITAWEMPLLSKFAKPFEPPAQDRPLRFRYTTYLGEEHPAAKKIVVEFCVQDLPGLTQVQRDKFIKLVGVRYNPETDIVKMSCEMFASQAQNKRYLGDLIGTVLREARDGKDTFEDVPFDFRHHDFRVKLKFPVEWRITEERKRYLEEGRRSRLLRNVPSRRRRQQQPSPSARQRLDRHQIDGDCLSVDSSVLTANHRNNNNNNNNNIIAAVSMAFSMMTMLAYIFAIITMMLAPVSALVPTMLSPVPAIMAMLAPVSAVSAVSAIITTMVAPAFAIISTTLTLNAILTTMLAPISAISMMLAPASAIISTMLAPAFATRMMLTRIFAIHTTPLTHITAIITAILACLNAIIMTMLAPIFAIMTMLTRIARLARRAAAFMTAVICFFSRWAIELLFAFFPATFPILVPFVPFSVRGSPVSGRRRRSGGHQDNDPFRRGRGFSGLSGTTACSPPLVIIKTTRSKASSVVFAVGPEGIPLPPSPAPSVVFAVGPEGIPLPASPAPSVVSNDDYDYFFFAPGPVSPVRGTTICVVPTMPADVDSPVPAVPVPAAAADPAPVDLAVDADATTTDTTTDTAATTAEEPSLAVQIGWPFGLGGRKPPVREVFLTRSSASRVPVLSSVLTHRQSVKVPSAPRPRPVVGPSSRLPAPSSSSSGGRRQSGASAPTAGRSAVDKARTSRIPVLKGRK
ncbi:MAG: hypothetical protein M1823_005701 [Watsoniomyces obsoletus]|nr:MAG: hypothetical protein M1823_005701 [Watsoniomyces obsoletus]